MPQFVVNPRRTDPYKQFKFRVTWDNQVVPGIVSVSGLARRTEVVELRAGGDPSLVRHSPGRTTYEPVTLARGVTHDKAFEDWAERVWSFDAAAGAEVKLQSFRKDVLIDLLNEAGQLVVRYVLHAAWPSEYLPLPELDAGLAATAFERLVLQHDGWSRDRSVTEPVEP
ncbi:phage tail protein [Luteimicrobium subarcticum]|uniref:Phage tail-like protein n=1 Tax=Luteimicrobium subarcticum TaxID=620910 RepID=A0A2M8WUX9_9MICO|nr:phage tail protein [Luteimicrobium subarcticum]PJI94733.1 phage tail-like protein [Luteimicrobium subarcticum]